jgi:hypothetical protein
LSSFSAVGATAGIVRLAIPRLVEQVEESEMRKMAALSTDRDVRETSEERERLLSQFSPRERRLVEIVMRNHALTAAEAIDELRACGGL